MDNEGNKKSAIDLHNTISAEQAYNMIKRSCQALIADPSQASKLPPTLLRGAPGVGKSTIVQQVAKQGSQVGVCNKIGGPTSDICMKIDVMFVALAHIAAENRIEQCVVTQAGRFP